MYNALKNYWINATIRKKLLTFVLTAIGCVSIFSLYLLITTYSYIHDFNSTVNEYFKISMLQHNNTKNNSLLTDYFRDANMETLANYNQSVDTFYSALLAIKANPHNDETEALLNTIEKTFEAYCHESDLAIKSYRNKNPIFQKYRTNAALIHEHLNDYLVQFLEQSLRQGTSVYSQLVADSRFILTLSSLLLICFLLCFFAFGLTLADYLTKPIEQLAAMSSQISKGNLNVTPMITTAQDEVGILTNSFNTMSNNIRKLVDDLQEKSLLENKLHIEELKNSKNQELLREAQFLALQSQINPHFLFNTLNTVSRVITLGRPEEGVRLIAALSTILRYNMGSQVYVTLMDELTTVKQYIHIQQYRFGERIKVSIDCEDNVTGALIPAFTLQPIIENSIIHGLEPKVEGGCVRIKAYLRAAQMIIKIIDNGAGIPKDKQNAIRSMRNTDTGKRTKSIGLSNVMERLTIFSGRPDCFSINSKPGLGTVVTIKLPVKRLKHV